MATLTAYDFFSVFRDLFPVDQQVFIERDRVVIDGNGYTTTITGWFDGLFLNQMSGTVTDIYIDYHGAPIGDVNGLWLDANTIFDQIHYGWANAYTDTVLRQITHADGSDGDDVITSRAAYLDAYGEGGDDVLTGWTGHDSLFGGLGRDKLSGQAGNDYLSGDGGADRLFGDAGNDTLYGGAGRDRLVGGAGEDRMTGGAGRDTFVFNNRSGTDSILDFDTVRDTLLIRTGLQITGRQVGDDALIEWGQNAVLLWNTDVDDVFA